MELVSERFVRKIAKKSDHKFHHHVAIIMGPDGIVAIGYNKSTIHAEAMAVRKLLLAGGKGSRLYSYRIRRDGRIGASKPCAGCEKAIRDAGIRYVYYSDYDGRQERMAL